MTKYACWLVGCGTHRIMELVAGLLSCALRSGRCLDERSSTLSSRAAPCPPSPDIAGVVGAITVDPSAGPHPPDSCAHEEHMSTQIEVLWAYSGRLPPDSRRCRGAQETTNTRRLTGGVRALRWNDVRRRQFSCRVQECVLSPRRKLATRPSTPPQRRSSCHC